MDSRSIIDLSMMNWEMGVPHPNIGIYLYDICSYKEKNRQSTTTDLVTQDKYFLKSFDPFYVYVLDYGESS